MGCIMKTILSLFLILFVNASVTYGAVFNPNVWTGNWSGKWNNTTFSSKGPIIMSMATNPLTKTLYFTIDVGGMVFGASDPPPFSGTGTYTNTKATVNFANALGSGTVEFLANGTITLTTATITAPGIAGMTITGQNVDGKMTMTYTISFTGGGGANGTTELLRRAIPPVNVGDLNGNGADEIASLKMDAFGNQKVYVKDSKTNALVRMLNFGRLYRPVSLVSVPDQNGNGKAEVALLGVHNTNASVLVRMRDAFTGGGAINIGYLKFYAPTQMVVVPTVTPSLAVLGTNATGRVIAQLRSAKTGATVRNVSFGNKFYATDFNVLATGTPSLVMLGIRKTDGLLIAQKRNSATGALTKNIIFGKVYDPLALLVESANQISMLGMRPSDRLILLSRKNAVTGAKVPSILYGKNYLPKHIMMVGNTGGSVAADIALLGTHVGNSSILARVRDSGTRITVKNIPFAKAYKAGAMVKLQSVNANASAELGVFGTTTVANISRVELRDTATRLFVGSITVP